MAKLTAAEIREQALRHIAEHKARQEAIVAKSAVLTQQAKAAEIAAMETSKGLIAAHIPRLFTGPNFRPSVPGMVFNDEQSQALERGMRGHSFCIIGAAGSGKTTTTQELIAQLLRMPHISQFTDSTDNIAKGTPAIVIVSFTRKAVNNIRKKLPPQLQRHCMTLHRLLEYMPERDENGKIIGFAPSRHGLNPLPAISAIIFEESSMIETELYSKYRRALPPGCVPQEIFLGDLNQLPPVFGDSILGFKLVQLPTVELVQIYRQALESPIIELAHRVREGKTLNWEFDEHGVSRRDKGDQGAVTIRKWKKRIAHPQATRTMAHVMLTYYDSGMYSPDDDIILCPFNVSFGCEYLNAVLATRFAKDRDEQTWEVIARGRTSYWAVGDKVLFDQQEARIISIRSAPGYTGKIPQDPCVTLDRFGVYHDGKTHNAPKTAVELLEELESQPVGERDKNAGSHIIKIEFVDTGEQLELTTAGDINKLLLAYVITVHKSQGSEWGRVFVALHFSHNPALSRELLYTAITRAKRELIMFIDPGKEGSMDSISRAARNPEIKGVTLAEKAQYFKGKVGEYKEQMYVSEQQ